MFIKKSKEVVLAILANSKTKIDSCQVIYKNMPKRTIICNRNSLKPKKRKESFKKKSKEPKLIYNKNKKR